jgi:undecaprenyl-diphosphatase
LSNQLSSNLVEDRPRHPHRLAVVAACAGLGFVALAFLAHQVAFFPIDLALTRWIQGVHAPWLLAPLMVLNRLGFPPLVGIIYGSIILVIFATGKRWEALVAGFAVLGGAALNNLTKLIVARPRPDPDLVEVEHHINNGTFPAGHVLNFTAFAGFLCYLIVVRRAPSWHRTALISLLILLIALMGLARIHSGEHWPTDVLGGYLLGGMWLAATVGLYRWGLRRGRRKRDRHAAEAPEPSPRPQPAMPPGESAACRDTICPPIAAGSRSLCAAFVLFLFATTAPFVRVAEAAAGDGVPPTPIIATAAVVAGDRDSSASADTSDLGPTSAPPWNPPRAMPRRQTWEQVVLLPGRIVSLPLSGLGAVTRAAMLPIEDSGLIPMAPRAGPGRPRRVLSFALPALGDRTGLGGTAELRSPSSFRPLILSARHTATLFKYGSTRVGASLGPIALQYGFDWRPQDRFYGIGISASRDSLTDFGAQQEFARGILQWGASPGSAPVHPHVSVSAWGGPRSLVTRTGRDSREVSFEERFPALGSATLDRRVEHLVYGGSLSADWRSGRPHWSHGSRLMLGVERYDTPVRALALHSSQFDGAQFTRYSIETEAGISFMRDPRTIRLLVRLTDQRVGSGRDHFLLSDMARLGGRDGLAGFAPGRFHDLDLLHSRLMHVFPLERLFEVEVHSEWGAVYPDVWKDATLGTLKHSFGLSLRARSDAAPRGALGFDVSSEGMRIHYALGGVE